MSNHGPTVIYNRPSYCCLCQFSCNYRLRRLSSIRRNLTPEATRCAVQALITPRMEYCNSLLLGNVLRTQYWLPGRHQIELKKLVIVFKCLHGLAPNYLAELLRVRYGNSRLRQAQQLTLSEQVSKRVIGRYAFGISATPFFNRLPVVVRDNYTQLKRTLKTHMFKLFYDQ